MTPSHLLTIEVKRFYLKLKAMGILQAESCNYWKSFTKQDMKSALISSLFQLQNTSVLVLPHLDIREITLKTHKALAQLNVWTIAALWSEKTSSFPLLTRELTLKWAIERISLNTKMRNNRMTVNQVLAFRCNCRENTLAN